MVDDEIEIPVTSGRQVVYVPGAVVLDEFGDTICIIPDHEGERLSDLEMAFDFVLTPQLLEFQKRSQTLASRVQRQLRRLKQLLMPRFVSQPRRLNLDPRSSVDVFPDEHPPPHFRVKLGDESANFAVATGERLAGQRGLKNIDREVRDIWLKNRVRIAEAWNLMRPTYCQAGRFEVPDEWRF